MVTPIVTDISFTSFHYVMLATLLVHVCILPACMHVRRNCCLAHQECHCQHSSPLPLRLFSGMLLAIYTILLLHLPQFLLLFPCAHLHSYLPCQDREATC